MSNKLKTTLNRASSFLRTGLKPSIINAFTVVKSFLSFFILVFVYFTQVLLEKISSRFKVTTRILSPFIRFLRNIAIRLDLASDGNPSRIDIIDLAMNNMLSKKTRTGITVGGMAIGISVIVFLLSIGYGLQNLVVSRVARLDELQQTDVSTVVGSKLRLNDETLASLKDIDGVEQALPSINVVGKVKLNNSATDMAVYGVTRDYLEHSAIKPVIGETFESNSVVSSSSGKGTEKTLEEKEAIIAGIGTKTQDVVISINQNTWLAVRNRASRDGQVIGYISNEVGEVQAEEVWGGSYIDNNGNGKAGISPDGIDLGLWLKVEVPLWNQIDGQYIQIKDNEGNQIYGDGYIANIDIAFVTGTDSSTTENGDLPEQVLVDTPTETTKEAVVNRSFLEIFQISESEAVGQQFEVTLIATGILLDSAEQRIQSDPTTYTIVGVTPDSTSPLFYIPFVDIRSLGINNFSQVKIVAESEELVPVIRGNIEALGFNTTSVSDTVDQIDSLFTNLRLVMSIVGFVALSISTLGMFNTLTVSLIERTREVGLLKAIGMKSYEVKDLFFAESILMGSLGGFLGLILGLFLAKSLELALSLFSISQGAGSISIVSVPLGFILSITILSFLVGFITGIYPARRATNISALNALRYE